MFDKSVYINRRDELIKRSKSLGLKGVAVLLGNSEVGMNYPGNTYRFRQDSTFLYFVGLDEPDMAVIVDFDSGESTLFANDVTIDDIIWMGPQPSVSEKATFVGIANFEQFKDLKEKIQRVLSSGREVHTLPQYRDHNRILLSSLLGISIEDLSKSISVPLIKAVVSLREIKEEIEIKELDAAAETGYAMHYTAMKMAKLGMVEQELVGIMEGIAISNGYMPSFPIILSQNGETLHNHNHSQILTKGRLLVVDAGAESASHYASDFTRTIPSDGRFTSAQKDIYDIVALANNMAKDLIRPGITYSSVHLEVARLITQGLKNLGIMKGSVEDAVSSGAHALFMPHGLGHQLGLDVHDMEDLGENFVGYDDKYSRAQQFGLRSLRMGKELKIGHVITNEPGIYFIPALIDKWSAEGINKEFINFEKLKDYRTFGGIRLEDDILLTKSGCRLLGTRRLPISTEDVEKEMNE